MYEYEFQNKIRIHTSFEYTIIVEYTEFFVLHLKFSELSQERKIAVYALFCKNQKIVQHSNSFEAVRIADAKFNKFIQVCYSLNSCQFHVESIALK